MNFILFLGYIIRYKINFIEYLELLFKECCFHHTYFEYVFDGLKINIDSLTLINKNEEKTLIRIIDKDFVIVKDSSTYFISYKEEIFKKIISSYKTFIENYKSFSNINLEIEGIIYNYNLIINNMDSIVVNIKNKTSDEIINTFIFESDLNLKTGFVYFINKEEKINILDDLLIPDDLIPNFIKENIDAKIFNPYKFSDEYLFPQVKKCLKIDN